VENKTVMTIRKRALAVHRGDTPDTNADSASTRNQNRSTDEQSKT
jgi:hypothetical protein